MKTLSRKLYLQLYLTQIVHSNGKMLFLAPDSCVSLTFFKEKLCVLARVGKSIARCLSCLTLSKKLYLRLYLIQIVHSYSKMLFLATNNCASLTFFKEKLSVSARVSKSLAWTVFTCVAKCYLSVVFAA